MTGTDDTLTISRGALLCRLEGFGAAPEALRALGAHISGDLAMRGADDGTLPLPDPATLARLVGPQVAARIKVEAEGSRLVLRLRAAEDADADAAALRHTPERDDPGLGAATAPHGEAEAARIFDSADGRMSERPLRERCSAHRHLRAALASTRAAAGAGEAPPAGVDDTPYRSDLAAARDAAPLPPLRLEPTQRVDIARPETAGDGEPGFAAFAKEMGAATLLDRLEAAAAWLADAQGRAAFPRAVLLDTLARADGTEPPLDEALEACARLLRDGRLEARPGGTLAPTDATRFRRAAPRGDGSGAG